MLSNCVSSRRQRAAGKANGVAAKSGNYDVSLRSCNMTPKSDYGGVPEDYDDEQGLGGSDMAYVYPSRTRDESSSRPAKTAGSESGCGGGAYDVVDGSRSIKSTSDGPYEKVSSCRYVHIWEMPLPKAPDE